MIGIKCEELVFHAFCSLCSHSKKVHAVVACGTSLTKDSPLSCNQKVKYP
jgi:hypothetical protein